MQEPPRLHIESFFNELVKERDGELVSDLLPPNPSFENADYVFKNDNVVAELKLEEILRFKQTKEEDFDYAVLKDTQQKLNEVMDVSGSLIDAELADLLLEFEHTLELILKDTGKTNIEGALPLVLSEAATNAVALRTYLEKQATKVESLQEFLNHVRNLTAKGSVSLP